MDVHPVNVRDAEGERFHCLSVCLNAVVVPGRDAMLSAVAGASRHADLGSAHCYSEVRATVVAAATARDACESGSMVLFAVLLAKKTWCEAAKNCAQVVQANRCYEHGHARGVRGGAGRRVDVEKIAKISVRSLVESNEMCTQRDYPRSQSVRVYVSMRMQRSVS